MTIGPFGSAPDMALPPVADQIISGYQYSGRQCFLSATLSTGQTNLAACALVPGCLHDRPSYIRRALASCRDYRSNRASESRHHQCVLSSSQAPIALLAYQLIYSGELQSPCTLICAVRALLICASRAPAAAVRFGLLAGRLTT